MPHISTQLKAEINATNARIAKNLKLFRAQRNLTQREVAELIGCSLQQFQKYENNKNRISTARLIILARNFGIPLHQFYEEPTPPNPQNYTPQHLGECLTHLTPRKRQILLNIAQDFIRLQAQKAC